VTTDRLWPGGSLIDGKGRLSGARDVDRNSAGVTSYLADFGSTGEGVYVDGGTPVFETLGAHLTIFTGTSPDDIAWPQVNRKGVATFWMDGAVVEAVPGSPPRIVDGDFWGVEKFQVSDVWAYEPSSASSSPTIAQLRVTRTGQPWDDSRPVVVHYRTEAASATAGSDFTPVEGDLTFDPVHVAGSPSIQTINVPILWDPETEGSETFRVVLSLPTFTGLPLATLVDGGIATVTIRPNSSYPDSLPPTKIDAYAYADSGPGSVTFTAWGPGDTSVLLSYHAEDISAQAGVD
jgi:hypothetical protein